MSEYIFSYGTLQKDRVQIALFGRRLTGSPDTLIGYKIEHLEIKDEAVLATSEQKYHLLAVRSGDENDRVHGMKFEITHEELLAADAYELEEYTRVKEVLASGEQSWVYVAK